MSRAAPTGMVVASIEDFEVWKKAKALWGIVEPLLARRGFLQNLGLRDQIREALDSITANMEEGFEQSTDRAFARYLYTSKGSAAEVRGRLGLAYERKFITAAELQNVQELEKELQRMLNGLIRYLLASNRKDRHSGRRNTKPRPKLDEVKPRTDANDSRNDDQ